MKRVWKIGVALVLWYAAANATEPVPFVNPHPFSASHFNPVMDGVKDRLELAYKHTSYYEEDTISYDGHKYTRLIDFESSEFSLFFKKSYERLSFTMDVGATNNHEGFMDNTIIYIHDRTGSTGGRWKRRKLAPRNEYHFSLIDENGNEVFKENKRWVYKANFYMGVKLPWGMSVRGGVKPPIEANDTLFATGDYEYAATLQKSERIGPVTLVIDYSKIWQAKDHTELEVRGDRRSANLFISYKEVYIQFNYIDPAYEETANENFDSFGGVYTFGYRGERWFFGITEDFSLYNSPDIALMIGYTF